MSLGVQGGCTPGGDSLRSPGAREVEVTEDVTVVEKVSGSSTMMVEQGFLDLRANRSVAQVVVVVAESVPS